MIYLLVDNYRTQLEAAGLGFLRVFTFVTFQATVSILLSFLLVILLGPRVIAWLRHMKLGDLPSFGQAEVDSAMSGKKGTPTMGGMLIIFAIGLTTLLLADLHNFYIVMGMVCLLGLGAIGASDDWLKLTAGRRSGSRQGLTSLEKLLGQVGLSLVLGYFTYRHGRDIAEAHTLYFPFFKNLVIPLGTVAFIALSVLVMTGSSNAVNLTDGLDGLASGCVAIVSFVLVVLAYIGGSSPLAEFLFLPHVPSTGQMAVMAGAMVGACLGFLWFNCFPARVFMGDTGSLALGGLLGFIAVVVRHEFTLLLVGGIFVAEAVSVMLQVGYFKYTRRRYGEGRRIFLMTPLHLHFLRKGWIEPQIVVRFWLIGAMLAAMALATVKLR
jgi:phospho-N-acetylmuramoyl-pentapeptide-transferase